MKTLKYRVLKKINKHRGISASWWKYVNLDQILKPFKKMFNYSKCIPMIKSNMFVLHVHVHQNVI